MPNTSFVGARRHAADRVAPVRVGHRDVGVGMHCRGRRDFADSLWLAPPVIPTPLPVVSQDACQAASIAGRDADGLVRRDVPRLEARVFSRESDALADSTAWEYRYAARRRCYRVPKRRGECAEGRLRRGLCRSARIGVPGTIGRPRSSGLIIYRMASPRHVFLASCLRPLTLAGNMARPQARRHCTPHMPLGLRPGFLQAAHHMQRPV